MIRGTDVKESRPLDSRAEAVGSAAFCTTHWSMVLRAGNDALPDSSQALERLCQTYWYPLYVFVRRKGHSPEDAQDLTQEFFARFLEKRYVSLADQSRGKFRTFLLRSLEHFLINEWTKARAIKRGGSHKIISWDQEVAEARYLADGADGLAPDKIFEKRWAISLLDHVLSLLHKELSQIGKGPLFENLKPYIWGEPKIPYADVSKESGMSEGAVKVAVHRLRHRYRELLRAEVAQTVSTDEEVDEELRYLVKAIRG